VLNQEAQKIGRVIDALLQVHIAEEESKFGFSPEELQAALASDLPTAFPHVRIRGLMGMATFTDNADQVRREFDGLAHLFRTGQTEMPPHFDQLSMGMSGDYPLAMECGATLIRVGTAIFGARNY